MSHRFVAALGLLLCLWSLSALGQEPVRVATWNIEGVNTSGTAEHAFSLAILNRIDADVVAVQEIQTSSDIANFNTLMSSAGYGYVAVSNTSGTLSGSHRNGVASIHPIIFAQSHSAATISGDINANDITRDIFEVHVQVPNTAERTAFFVVHLKASSGSTNDFRRAVELARLNIVVNNFRSNFPQAAFFILGDFNDDLGDGGFGANYSSLPSGLPSSFSLGIDLSFPISYKPFSMWTAQGLSIANTTQEDSTFLDATRDASGRRLDYMIFGGGAVLLGDEIYNSARDNGFDDPPVGNFLSKVGTNLPSSTSLSASDHYLVFADLQIPSSQMLLYPGTPDDFVMTTGINGPMTGGPGEDVKLTTADDYLFINYRSPNGTFDFAPPIVVVQSFTSAGQPPIGLLPGMHFNLNGAIAILDATVYPSGFQPLIIPTTGNSHVFRVPHGFQGTSSILQCLAVSGLAWNTFIAFSEAHQLDIY